MGHLNHKKTRSRLSICPDGIFALFHMEQKVRRAIAALGESVVLILLVLLILTLLLVLILLVLALVLILVLLVAHDKLRFCRTAGCVLSCAARRICCASGSECDFPDNVRTPLSEVCPVIAQLCKQFKARLTVLQL